MNCPDFELMKLKKIILQELSVKFQSQGRYQKFGTKQVLEGSVKHTYGGKKKPKNAVKESLVGKGVGMSTRNSRKENEIETNVERQLIRWVYAEVFFFFLSSDY